MKCIQSDLKSADAISGDKELNYQGFVIALVEVANICKSKLRNDAVEEQEPKEC